VFEVTSPRLNHSWLTLKFNLDEVKCGSEFDSIVVPLATGHQGPEDMHPSPAQLPLMVKEPRHEDREDWT
jgi:hypothetical protein